MIGNKYTIDDLIQFTRLGRFGSPEMNTLAAYAFMDLKRLQYENKELKKKIDDSNIEIFQVSIPSKENKE